MHRRLHALLPLVGLACVLGLVGCKRRAAWERGKKVAHFAVRAKLGTLDPVRSSSTYDNEVQSQIYETLLTYKYLKRPYELEPALAASMPTISEDGLTYTFDIKKGVLFHDNECFPDGIGRELVAKDFEYAMKRLADPQNEPTGWWLLQNRIVGLDDFETRMSERGDAPFEWDAPIEGLKATGTHQLQIKLIRPFPQMLYVLAMTYTAAVARECVEYYGEEYPNTAIGTGAFKLRKWVRGSKLILDKNPKYREVLYPSEASPEYEHMLGPAGQKVPFLDAIVYHVYEKDQPMWLKFRAGDLDMSQVPAEYQEAVFTKDYELRESMKKDGIKNYNLPLLDMIYRGFNMEDPVVGQGEKAKLLRQAIALAWDVQALNDRFYNGACIMYDGPVPPGLDAYVPGVTSPYRGPKLEEAKALLAKAGYPDGKGVPTLVLDTSNSGNSEEQAEMFKRALAQIGIELDVSLNSFAELSTKLKKKKAQMFGLAWGGDYPDAENFLQLFYGPNEAPGSNNFNMKNAEYDALYEKSRTLQPGPERTEIYKRMREIHIEEVPSFGHLARTRFYLWHGRLKNVLPDETFDGWRKYVDIEVRN